MNGFSLLMWSLAFVALAYVALPIASIFGFAEPEAVFASLARPKVVDALILSMVSASISTALVALFGIPLAFCLARYRFPGRFLVRVVVVIPLVTPPLASGALLLGMFGPQSYIIAHALPGFEFTQSLVGIIIAQTYVASPFMILAGQAAFESVDKSYETIALVLGKRKLAAFVLVSLPLAKKGILVGILMTWVRAVGELGATMMMAYNPHTISIQIFEDNAIGGLRMAIPSIVLVVLLSVAVMFAFSLITNRVDGNDAKNMTGFGGGGEADPRGRI